MPRTICHIHVWDKKNKGDVAIVLAVKERLRKHFPDYQIVNLPAHKLKTGYSKEEINLVNQSSFVLIGGGGLYYDFFTPFDIQTIGQIKRPVVTYGLGYIKEIGSRELEPIQKESIKILFEKSRLNSVRDFTTKNFLKSIKVDTKNLRLIGDPALFLSEPKASRFKKKTVGINLHYAGWMAFSDFEVLIVQSFKDLIKSLGKGDYDVVYLSHHPDEARLVRKYDFDLPVIDQPARKQKAIYGELELVVGMMLHSVVLAAGAGVPFLNVGYDIRNKGFGDFMGLPELIVPATKLETINLTDRALGILAHRQDYIGKIKKRNKEIERLQNDYLKEVKKLVE